MKKTLIKGFICSLLASVVLLTGCGSSSDNAARSYEKAVATTDSYEVYDENYAASAGGGDATSVSDPSRKLITNMSISSETRDLDQTLAMVEAKVSELGGYVENSNISNGSSYNAKYSRSASYVIRIPSAKLDEFVTVVEEGTSITSKSVSVEDITLQYVDTESKKKSLKAEEARLLEIMEQAETVEDIIAVEDKLADVRYQLESIESQLRTYDNLIDYSTVNLYVDEVAELRPQEQKGFLQRIGEGFVYNLKAVGHGIVELFIWILIHIPQLVILGAVIALVVFLIKKRKRKNGK